MVGSVAKVVEPTLSVGEKSTGCGAHAVAVGTFNDVGYGKEGGSADGVVFWTGPEAEDNEIGFLGLPPEWVSNVLLRNPENGRDERFRISDFGMWPYFVSQLRDYAGLLPRVIKFFVVRHEALIVRMEVEGLRLLAVVVVG